MRGFGRFEYCSILISKRALVVAFLMVVVLLVVVALRLHNSCSSGIVLFSFGFACLGMVMPF